MGREGKQPDKDAALPLRVVLVSPRNPLNIGAAARAISNFGLGELRLVNAYDVAFREAKSAVNAGWVLEQAREFASVAEAVADCSLVVGTTALGPRELTHPMRRLETGGLVLRKHLAGAPAALLFGSEKFGLGNDDLAHCHWLMRIPTREEHGSMNLGQAVAVCLYELVRSSAAVKVAPGVQQRASGEEEERLSERLFEALLDSGYVPERTRESSLRKTRQLIRRMDLASKDAEVLHGMLRQIVWKLSQSK
jgi:tRNA/rRNA methyltransferase